VSMSGKRNATIAFMPKVYGCLPARGSSTT